MARTVDRLSPTGVLAAPASWPELLADPARALAVEPRWCGRNDRRDRWCHDAPGWGWQVVWLVESGTCAVRCGDLRGVLAPGTLLWWPTHSRLTVAWPERFVFREVWFRLDGVTCAGDGVLRGDTWEALPWLAAIEDVMARGDGLPPALREARLRHLLALIAVEATAPPARAGTLTAAQRAAVQAALGAAARRDPTPAQLARAAGLAPDYFARRFRAPYGCAPRTWLVRERMRRAARLLRDGSPAVAAVAAAVGCDDPARFCRQFRAVHGVSPSRWRG